MDTRILHLGHHAGEMGADADITATRRYLRFGRRGGEPRNAADPPARNRRVLLAVPATFTSFESLRVYRHSTEYNSTFPPNV